MTSPFLSLIVFACILTLPNGVFGRDIKVYAGGTQSTLLFTVKGDQIVY